MPKNRKVVKQDNRVLKVKVPSKMRIGTRGGGKSAFLMSNSELVDVTKSDSKKKWHGIARSVLNTRGVEL